MRKRVERDSGTHCVSGVNPSIGLVDASNRNYFSQNTPCFYSTALFGPIFNFFPLIGLKYNLPQILGKIGFFLGKYWIFLIFLDFLLIFFLHIFFLSKLFSCCPKTDFSSINRPKNPIFCSLV